MASIELTHRRNYSRGIAVVLGVMVVFAFMMLVISAAPGKEMLEAHGVSASNPVAEISSIYSAENMRCAFNSMSCNIVP